jgi:transmembrane sensor
MNTVDKYEDYFIEDFVWDEQFRGWVLSPDPYSIQFWSNWLKKYPEKVTMVQQAKELVKSLSVTMEKLSDQKKEELIAKTLKGIDTPVLHPTSLVMDNPEVPVRKRNFLRFSIGIAAAFLLAIFGNWLIVNEAFDKNIDYTYKALVKQSKTALLETKNTSSIPLLILLSDGSKVKLDKGGKISYAPSFVNLDKREVYLSGNAFFEITKNPLKPFFVHANGIVTKVLGTSFLIKTDIIKKGVTVEVVTGRVEVYEQKFSGLKSNSKRGNGVILTPNQKVVYSGEKGLFETSLVDEPVPIIKANKKIAKEDFVFEDAPLSRVIEAIENIYGIKVEVENDAILNCPFTGDISEQNLFRKFDAICQTTKTTYEIKETKVFIKGHGCY